jgi:hypothetical protein
MFKYFQLTEKYDIKYRISLRCIRKSKGKAIPVTGHGTHRFVRRRGSHVFYTIGS